MDSDSVYFRRRALEEREACAKAVHPEARQAHLELAERYEELVQAIESNHQRLGLHAVS